MIRPCHESERNPPFAFFSNTRHCLLSRLLLLLQASPPLMACFRRIISLSSLVSRYSRVSSLIRLPISPSPLPATIDNGASSSSHPSQIRSRSFQSTSGLFSASRSFNNNQDDVIDENTILFEGCDYKHWLITMDFPKDPKPSPEEMVETYVQTLAKVVGSVEEAKRRMYACSTTTYNGFQAEMDEETANKFEGMPGVVFVLPDSYIDPVNKEYGGDKYINGTIIPRPPPVQYGRQRRNRDQPPRGQMQNQRWGPTYDQQGSTQADAGNYAPQQGPPHQQNYNPQQGFQPQQNFPPQQQYGGPQNYSSPQNHGQFQNHPSPQNHGHFQNYPSQNYGHPQHYPSQQNYGPPRQEQRPNPRSTYGRDFPASGRDAYQEAPDRGSNDQGHNFSHERRGYSMDNQSNYTVNQRDGVENNQTYTPPSPARGSYEQGGPRSFGHNQAGSYGPRPGAGGNYGPGSNSGCGHDISGQRDQRNFQPTESMGMDQGRR